MTTQQSEKVKITVVKKSFFEDLAMVHRPKITSPCPSFVEGQEFLVDGINMPEGFCGWAWNDIYKLVIAFRMGASSPALMKDNNSYVACCTDGIRPVSFKIERIDD